MADRTISIGFKLENGADGFQKLIMSADDLKKALRASVVEAEGFHKQMINFTAVSTGINNALGSLTGLRDALNEVTDESRGFGDAMRATNTMAGKDAAGLAALREQVSGLSREVPVARDALANGLYQVISNGVPEDNWISFLEASARSSVGGMADLGQVVGVTSTIIKNYGASWDEAGAIQDKIQLTAKNGVTDFGQLGAALPRVTANAATLGVSIDELMGTFATLTGVSGNTAEVSTQLAAVFNSLVKPSSEATRMAREMGIQFDAAAIKAAGGFQAFLSDLDRSVKSYSAASGVLEQEVYGKLFGSAEALRALIPLNGELADTFSRNVATMADSAGTMDAAFESMSQTGESAAQALKNKFAAFGDMISEATSWAKPFLNVGISALSAAANVGILAQSFVPLKTIVTGSLLTRLVMGLGNVFTASGRAAIRAQGFANAARSAAAAARGWQLAMGGLLGMGAVGLAIWGVTEAMEAMNRKSEEAAERQRRLNEVKLEQEKRFANERKEIELLVAAASNEKVALDERLDAVKKLNEIIPGYNAQIDRTTGQYQASTKALNEHITALRRKIALESIQDQIRKNIDKTKALRAEEKTARKVYWKERAAAESTVDQLSGVPMPVEALAGAILEAADKKDKAYDNLVDKVGKLNEAIKEGMELDRQWMELKETPVRTPATSSNGNGSTGNGDGSNGDGGGSNGKGSKSLHIEPELPEGSIAALEKRIREIDAKIDLEVDMSAIARLTAERNAIEKQIREIKARIAVEVDKASIARLIAEKNAIDKQMGISLTTDFILNKDEIISEIMEIPVPDLEVNCKVKMPDKLEGLPEKLEGLPSVLAQSKEKSTQLAQGMSQVAGSLQQMGSNLGIPAIDVMGTIAGAIATLVAGYATATSQAAALGPWGWIGFAATGLAQLTAIVASVKNLPKFAEGGIAYGPTVGLFGEYAGASTNPEVVAPLDKLRSLITPAYEGGGRIYCEDITIDAGKLRLAMRYEDRRHSRM